MKYFLTEKNRQLLEAFAFTKALYAFDFDGTLAKIVPNPDDAYMNQRTEKLLLELAKRAPVAVISGRGVQDLRKRIPKKIEILVGNHGLEGIQSKASSLKSAQEKVLEWKRRLLQMTTSGFIGVEIEDKTYSLSLHYRRSRKKKETRKELLQLIETFKTVPRIVHGKSVLNLIPPGAPHKGMAVASLLSYTKSSKALYVGDDETDEDVFSLNDSRILGVHVGKKNSSQAPYYLEEQSEINEVLKLLLSLHKGTL
jgi:trehalose 6-phosphate phosphatase